MKKNEKCVLNLCLFYIIYVFMYGIVIKFTISNGLIFQVKTYIPEIILGLIALLVISKNGIRLKRYSLMLLMYSLLVFAINFCIYGFPEQALYCIRDIYIPLIAFCFLMQVRVSDEGMNKFAQRLVMFFKVYIIVGLILAVVQQIMGWEWASTFYTGYSFYGQDPVSKVKIAHNLGLLRAPSLSGNFATFGYYCLIAAIFIDAYLDKVWKKLFWDVLAVICMVLATNKSAIVAFAVVFILRFTGDIRKKSTWANRLVVGLILMFAAFSAFMLMGDNNDGTGLLTSVFARFDIWKDIFNDTSVLELVVPYKIFTYGSGVEGGLGFWDNTYLYCVFTQGILGTALWARAIMKTYRIRIKDRNKSVQYYVYELTIVLLILGLTVNITQGRGYLAHYLVLLSVGTSVVRGGVFLLSILCRNVANNRKSNTYHTRPSFEWRCMA